MSSDTRTTDRLWEWLGVWKSRRRLAACFSGLMCAALAGSPCLAAPPSPFPPAFATAPLLSAPSTQDGPDLGIPDNASGPELPPTPNPKVLPPKICTSPIQQATFKSQDAVPIPGSTTEIVPNLTQMLNRDAAVRWALQFNPEIAAIRQQHGIAAASVVIARTYPFNPILESRVRGDNGPTSATITSHLDMEYTLLLEVELRGQGHIRQQGAAATLSRTDNEIAFQELSLAVRASRVYDTLLYRQQKAVLADEAVQLTQDNVEKVRRLVEGGKLRAPDLILIRTELNDFIAQANVAHAAVIPAITDFRRALGIVEGLEILDTLEAPVLHLDTKTLVNVAMLRRPDRQAREAAVAEAEARLNLERANRYGNMVIGPNYAYDATRIDYIGAHIGLPIPVFNQHTGEIRMREAERERAALELRQSEVDIVHDVEGAIHRLESARGWAETFRTKILPELKTSLEDMERLFAQFDPNVDVLRLLDVRRKLLRARDGYLDALWELRQAQADLAAALGDPSLLAPSLRGAACAAGPAHLPPP
jgi:outer membrane protein TolC